VTRNLARSTRTGGTGGTGGTGATHAHKDNITRNDANAYDAPSLTMHMPTTRLARLASHTPSLAMQMPTTRLENLTMQMPTTRLENLTMLMPTTRLASHTPRTPNTPSLRRAYDACIRREHGQRDLDSLVRVATPHLRGAADNSTLCNRLLSAG
jgi:hypothetical protein